MVGLLIDAGVLTILVRVTSMDPLHARLISMALAISVTWLINRRYAFARTRPIPGHLEYAAYFAIQLVGVGINYAVFALLLRTWPSLTATPVLPAAAGSATAMLVNFVALRRALYQALPARTP